jgi:hypothetical protein
MNAKSETKISEARKKVESRKQKSASFSVRQTLPNEEAGMETLGLQSSDFFRVSHPELQISAESTSLKQFNSEF